jgi:hypothetical protein
MGRMAEIIAEISGEAELHVFTELEQAVAWARSEIGQGGSGP